MKKFVHIAVVFLVCAAVCTACLINNRVQNIPKGVVVRVLSGRVELLPEVAYNKGLQTNDPAGFEDIIYLPKPRKIISAGEEYSITLFDSESVTLTVRAYGPLPARIVFQDGRMTRDYTVEPENRVGLIIGASN